MFLLLYLNIYFLKTPLNSITTQFSKFILYIFCPIHDYPFLQGALVPFIGEWCKKLTPGYSMCLLLLCASKDFQLREKGSIYMYILTCIKAPIYHLSTFLYIIICIYIKLNISSYQCLQLQSITTWIFQSSLCPLFVCKLPL